MRRSVRLPVIATVGVLAVASLAAASPASAAAGPVINEFSASTTGTDVEYIELLAPPGSDLSAYRVLHVEGDAPTLGIVDSVLAPGAPDASGRVLLSLAANTLENGTISLLLVTGTIPSVAGDIDTNNDGVVDAAGLTVVDSIAINDGGAGDLTYGGVTLTTAYDGLSFTPGGASRYPDGTDTDTVGDWLRNDFDLAGIPGFGGTLVPGEAANTPGAPNALKPPPAPGEADCEGPAGSIAALQGAGPATPTPNATVRIRGTVTADFQDGGFDGYYVQDGGDGNPATSDGIFVYAPGAAGQPPVDVAVGDVVSVGGVVLESFGMTQVTAGDAEICASAEPLPVATELRLPVTSTEREALEGMYVTLPQSLAILEFFEFGRFGTIDVGLDRQYQPTATYEPGSAEASAAFAANAAERITLDDGRGIQNPDPAIHPNGDEFTLDNTFRGGDLVTDVTGVLDYRFSTYAVQQTQGAGFESINPRPLVPAVGGDLRVSSFNVLNYFTDLDPTPEDDSNPERGANTAEELARQQAKIVAALEQIDADVFGLIEIQNNGTALATLTAALNAQLGADVYDYVETGPIGTDVIATAFMYKSATVEPVGDFAYLTESDDPRWLDDLNRPALTQTFAPKAGGEPLTISVNHLKSKGSSCAAVGDPTDPDGQGNCNGVRTQAATALAEWLAADPTDQGTQDRNLIIGDLNAYDKEDPIQALTDAGYTDLVLKLEGEDAYSYVFDGQLGYLDHALASPGLVADVTGASPWNINSDEPSILDYDMTFKADAQDALYAPDPFRSSDHDPVLVGIDLDTTPPTLSLTASPAAVFPPNGAERTVTVNVLAQDDSGEVTVELVSAEASGSKKAAVTTVDDTTFRVVAANKAVYEFTYRATDAAGNTTTESVTVLVGPLGGS